MWKSKDHSVCYVVLKTPTRIPNHQLTKSNSVERLKLQKQKQKKRFYLTTSYTRTILSISIVSTFIISLLETCLIRI